jgi:YVTN family beta-propeller protein
MVRILTIVALFAALSLGLRAGASAAQRCGNTPMYDVAVPGAPMSAIPTPDEQTIFVALNSTDPRQQNGIAVLRCVDGRYQFQRVISVENQPAIMSLTPDASTLVVPDDNFIAFLDVSRALSANGAPIAGAIEDIPGDDGGAIYSAVDASGRYAFVAEESSAKLTIVDLQKMRGGAGHDAIASEFLIGNAPVALVPSKDGKYLFATVQVALKRYGFAKTCAPEGRDPSAPRQAPGAVATIDLSKAVTDPEHAIVSYVASECHPVRAALTPDGRTLWVTARGSNTALAFSSAALTSGGAVKPIAAVKVGPAPVPVGVTPDGRYVLVGNSNRFANAATNQDVIVIDAASYTVVGRIPVGKFPRQFTSTVSGSTMFLCNYGSNSITVIDPTAIESLMKPA